MDFTRCLNTKQVHTWGGASLINCTERGVSEEGTRSFMQLKTEACLGC